LVSEVAGHLKAIADTIPKVQNFDKESIEAFLKNFIEEQKIKFKAIAQPLRVALTGKTVSPGIDEIMVTLGRQRVMQRINDAIAYIDHQNQ
jgi:glutamyl-tRNA synthetase